MGCLATALALAMVALASASAALSPCTWNPETKDAYSSCTVNTDFIVSYASTIGKSGSAFARWTLGSQVHEAACQKHAVMTSGGAFDAKGAAACLADKTNQCRLSPLWSNLTVQCSSWNGDTAFLDVICKGNTFYDLNACLATPKSQCSGICTPSVLYQWGPRQSDVDAEVVAFKNLGVSAAYIASLQEVSTCFPKTFIAAAFPNGGAYSSDGEDNWFWSSTDSVDPKVYLSAKGRGNCTYAQHALARTQQSTLCGRFNTIAVPEISGKAILRTDTPANTSGVIKALAAGCYLSSSLKATSTLFKNNKLKAEFLSSVRDEAWAAQTQYDAKLDGAVYTAATTCPQLKYQFDEAACKGVKA